MAKCCGHDSGMGDRTRSPAPPPEVGARRIYDALARWEFGVIIQYALENNLFGSTEEAEVVREEYTRYLAVDEAYELDTPISPEVDKFWHLHLLFSEDYATMCRTVLGRFRHHRPAILDIGKPPRKYDTNMSNYRALFGQPNKSIWPDYVPTERCSD